jgi:hypothetical protein
VLAAAGLKRLGLESRIRVAFEPDEMLPAAGQGALGIEVRADRADLIDLLAPLAHQGDWLSTAAERAVSRAMGGSCSMPLAAHARWQPDGALRIDAAWGDPEGNAPLVKVQAQAPAGSFARPMRSASAPRRCCATPEPTETRGHRMTTRPVIVTRPAREAVQWVEDLRAAGLDAVALPLIVIEPVADAAPLRAAWSHLADYAALMFVSATAVEHFFEHADAAVSLAAAVSGPRARAPRAPCCAPAYPLHRSTRRRPRPRASTPKRCGSACMHRSRGARAC